MNHLYEPAFDVFLARISLQNQKAVFQFIAKEAAPLCGIRMETLLDHLFDPDLQENATLAPGVLVLDMRSEEIAEPVGVLMTLEKPIEYHGKNTAPVDIVGAVFSPFSTGAKHLQTLASISRLLRDEKLCVALRSAEKVDTLKALLMPPYQDMEAA